MAYATRPNGVFVLPGYQRPLATPAASVTYPDGSTAYNVLIK
jgi:hypothetical protein